MDVMRTGIIIVEPDPGRLGSSSVSSRPRRPTMTKREVPQNDYLGSKVLFIEEQKRLLVYCCGPALDVRLGEEAT